MNNLHEELEIIRELNLLRDRAKDLRERGLGPLRNIRSINYQEVEGGEKKVELTEIKENTFDLDDWFGSGNEVEVSLVVKVQNHPDISSDEESNNNRDATPELKKRLSNLDIEKFFPKVKDLPASTFGAQPTVSVLMAARIMQALVSRSNTVFSTATMYCYYSIVRELYVAGTLDWTVGAARAGIGGRTSAFVTGECVRAIFSLENAIRRSATFLETVRRLNTRHAELTLLIESLDEAGKNEQHPLRLWANQEMERMWLDCQIAINLRGGHIAHFFNSEEKNFGFDQPNELLPKDISKSTSPDQSQLITLNVVKQYLSSLEKSLPKALKRAQEYLQKAESDIENFRQNTENPYEYSSGKPVLKKEYQENRSFIQAFHRAESAHLNAFQMIKDAVTENQEVIEIVKDIDKNFDQTLEKLIAVAERIAQLIHRVADPIKQYIKTVIRREFAEASLPSPNGFDPGELVFATTAYGTMTDWKPSELLTRACNLLRDALPENGRLMTRRPLHTSQHGYRLLPIGCEMTRALAQLFQKTNYEIDPVIVGRMINIFEEKLISLPSQSGKEMIGWNFDNSPRPHKPSVWVSAVSVLALDRIVRMLNTRINNSILKYFDVYRPEKPHVNLTLNDLVFSDYGFSLYNFYQSNDEFYKKLTSIPISLELMRAHVTRSSLPPNYIKERKTENPVFSVIFYGPPGTGKTTLAEATALSAQVTVVNLSPNDLLVQGQEFIEGRARDVFEALSMLTHVVIILDEFEPILERRIPHESPLVVKDESNDPALNKMALHLKEISHQVDPQFKFLVAGMLPRLLKLHDVAKKQSVAYCLATNHLNKIDDAAKRPGRFDLTIPVYNPCPLSRAGLLLLKLVQVNPNFKLDSPNIKRFVEVLAHTTNESASELAGNFFKSKKREDGTFKKSDYLKYILDGTSIKLDFNKADKMVDPESMKDKLEESEIYERKWLIEFEKSIQAAADSTSIPSLETLLSKPKAAPRDE